MKRQPHLRSPADPGFSYKDYPFYLLSRASGQYNAQMGQALKSLGLDQGEWRILLVLMEHESIGVARLAERIVTNLSTTTRIIQRLERAQHVASEQSGSDARIKNVWITDTGRALVDDSRIVAANIFVQAFEGVDAKSMETFSAVLKQIDANLLPGAR